MRHVFDIRAVQSRHHAERGIARYVRSLGEAIEQVAPGFITDYLIDPDFPLPPGAEWAVRTGRCRRHDDVPSWLRAEGGVYLIGSPFEESDGMEGVMPTWARGPRWQIVSILYDLIPLRFPDQYLVDRGFRVHHDTRLAVLRRADRLLAISEASRDDAAELLPYPPNRIEVIWAGTEPRYQPSDLPRDVVARRLVQTGRVPGLREDYLLFTGGPDPRKNLDGLFEAYATLDREARRAHQLVVVCKLDERTRSRIETDLDRRGILDDVLLTGFVEDRTLVELTQAAALVVFPSLYEGFGLPVLEARRCGAPVICGDNSSLVEVMPLAEARFDADDPAAIAAAIERVLADEDLQARLRAMPIPENFTWEAAAATTVETIERLHHRVLTDQAAMDRRRTLAVVMGAADQAPVYVRDLVAHLADRVEVSVGTVDPSSWPDTVRTVPPDRLRLEVLCRRPYDAVVSIVGTDHDGPEQLDTMQRHGNAVVLVSADLRGLCGIGRDQDPTRTATSVEQMYPGRYVRDASGLPNVDPTQSLRSGMTLAAAVTERADHLFALDRYTAELVHLDRRRRVEVLPAWLTGPTEVSPEVDDGPSECIIWLDCPLAAPDDDMPVQAMGRLRHRGDVTTMRIMTQDPARVAELATVATQVGVRDQVEIGPVEWISDHRALVLYYPSRNLGGVPELVVQAIRRGQRVAVGDLGALSEITAPNVAHIDPHAGPEDLADELARLLAGAEVPEPVVSHAIAEAADLIVQRLFDRDA